MNVATQRQGMIPNAVLGMLIFIGTEIMYFSALISAFLVIKAQVPFWPPPGEPRLPVEATAFNTLVLLGSWVALHMAGRSQANHFQNEKTRRLLLIAIGMGAFFVLFQGAEWVRMISFGLTMVSSVYGGMFYVIIGSHALHVTGALAFLVYLWMRMEDRGQERLNPAVLTAARILWTFVVGVWPILYLLVYINW
ncbi:MAG: cytochrome c oxidase subunit 3 [Deltaproteobacteria bacterium]|nr:cytochrome c oxidase subunit 3 [Deltaproteobacteria bacterium]